MVRLLVLYNKPTNVEEFERHYRDVHIPLVRKLSGLRRYTLSRNIAAIRGGDPYYLVAELDWDDMAAIQRSFQSPEGLAASQDADLLEGMSPGIRGMIYELDEA